MHGMCFDMLTPMLYIFTEEMGQPHVTRALPGARLSLPHMYCSWYAWQGDP